MKTTNSFITDHIRILRRQKGFDQEYMSRKLSIKQPEYSKIENGKIKDFHKYLPEIAKILDLDYEDLVSWEKYQMYNTNGHHSRMDLEHEHVVFHELLIKELRDKDLTRVKNIQQLELEIEGLKQENNLLRKLNSDRN